MDLALLRQLIFPYMVNCTLWTLGSVCDGAKQLLPLVELLRWLKNI